jgi:SAM-dependent methyltransferase
MSYDYDKLYAETQHALGTPTQAFVDFFADYSNADARVLDIGCGQGRDTLFIARLGHAVVGVDLSSAGIADLQAEAARENLNITGVVADITEYAPDGKFDIVLIDRTLHMLDEAPRHAVLARFLDYVAPDGYLLIADERSNMAGFQRVITAAKTHWHTIMDKRGFLFLRHV